MDKFPMLGDGSSGGTSGSKSSEMQLQDEIAGDDTLVTAIS